MSDLTPMEKYRLSQFKRDLDVLTKRLGLDVEFWWDDDSAVIRFDAADEPWLDYDLEGQRVVRSEPNASWKREEPFWALIDRAAILRDSELEKLWEDACFELSWNRDRWKATQLGLTEEENEQKAEAEKLAYRPVWDSTRRHMGSNPGSAWRKYDFEED